MRRDLLEAGGEARLPFCERGGVCSDAGEGRGVRGFEEAADFAKELRTAVEMGFHIAQNEARGVEVKAGGELFAEGAARRGEEKGGISPLLGGVQFGECTTNRAGSRQAAEM